MRRSRRRTPHRRKREGKTDYRVRLSLLKSRKPRLVVRKSLNNVICQIVKFDPEGDRVVVSADSKELKKFGWKFHCGNVPSAYLTGLLCAEKAKKHKVSEAILDIGLYESTPGNRLYSALKGAVDGGLEVHHSEDVLPKPERLAGQHISEYAGKLKSSGPTKYRKVFSSYKKSKLDPKDMPKIFEQTKKKISGAKERKKKASSKSKK
ncbi:MAG: 50S ribosomal protein L18 [Candidatus Aenigmarchaeota archaeon]|nr:50S ribosomal protein L18 [Candidatus Aenigmarchaeota archaeon]